MHMRISIAASTVAMVLATAGGPMSAQTTTLAMLDRNKAIVTRQFDAWRDGTGSPYDLLAEDASWTIVGRSHASKTYDGREAFLREVIRPFNARMASPLRPEVRYLYADGDTVIVFFDARGTARDGTPYENTYAWFLTLREDRIVRAFAFFDSVAFNALWTGVTPTAQAPRP